MELKWMQFNKTKCDYESTDQERFLLYMQVSVSRWGRRMGGPLKVQTWPARLEKCNCSPGN